MTKTKTVPISKLKHDKKNARRHNDRNKSAIRKSLDRFGAGRSIVIDADDIVRAGNGTIQEATDAGFTEVVVVEPEPGQLVAVRRPEWSEKEAEQYAIADNRSAELAQWDGPALSAIAADLREDELAAIGFEGAELEEVLERTTTVSEHERSLEQDEVPDPPKVAVTKPGDVWELGRHRLVCGDATAPPIVRALLGSATPNIMATDPPYGVEYDPEWRDGADLGIGDRSRGKVANDNRSDWREAWALFPGSVVYVWHASLFASTVYDSVESQGFEIRSQIIWAKQHFALSRGHYHWQHEPCWYAVRKGSTANWLGDRKQTSIWQIANNNAFGGGNESKWGHGTQKPIECMARPIRNHAGDVFDPFLGSGTTLIAAEQLDRTCYGIEIEPRYCDVVVERWSNLTGGKPRRTKP